MGECRAVFVIVDEPSIISPALRMFDGGGCLEFVSTNSPRLLEAPVSAAPRTIPVIALEQEDSAERALSIARSGAGMVICTGSPIEARLKMLAPASLILRAATPDQLAKALRQAFG